MIDRKYVICCNEHKGIFNGAMLFWGHYTQDNEKRSFGGYTSDVDKCEYYTLEEIQNSGYHFPIYKDGMSIEEFRKYEDIAIEPELLMKLGLRKMRIWYRP